MSHNINNPNHKVNSKDNPDTNKNPTILILKHFKRKKASEAEKRKYKRLGRHLILSDYSYYTKVLSRKLSRNDISPLVLSYKRKDELSKETKRGSGYQFYLVYIKKISSSRGRYTFKQIRRRSIFIPVAPHIFLLLRIKSDMVRKFKNILSSDDVIQWLRYNCEQVLIIPFLSPFDETSKKKLIRHIRLKYLSDLSKLHRKIKKLKTKAKDLNVDAKKIEYSARGTYSELKNTREVLQLLQKTLGISLSKEYNKVYVSFMRFYKSFLLRKVSS